MQREQLQETIKESKARVIELEAKSDERALQMQAQFNVQKCEKTLSSDVDLEHVKNMLLRFYRSPEADVRSNALKVLCKALEFSEEEKAVFM